MHGYPRRRFGLLLIVVGVLVVAAAVWATRASMVVLEVAIDPSRIHIETEDGFDVVTLNGGSQIFPGRLPDLPLYPVNILLPEGTRAVAVRVIPVESTSFPGPFRLSGIPTTGRHPFEADWSRTAWKPVAGEGPGLVPTDPVLRFRTGRLRGQSVAAVAVAPIRWSPSTGEIVALTRFRVEVETEPVSPRPDDLVVHRESEAGKRSFSTVFSDMTGEASGAGPGYEVLSAVPNHGPQVNSGAPFAPTFRPSVDGSPVEMVIITTPDQESEYQRIADFKTKTGISTVVRTVDWIKTNYPRGSDTPETIRNFIGDAVSMWGATWVLLGGDTDVVPARFAVTRFFGGEEIPTDLYYSDLDGNWNGDGDGMFGEGETFVNGEFAEGDGVDLFPDVWVGRLTSRNAGEAKTVVDKTLNYVQNPPMGYQNRHLYAAEVLFPQIFNQGDPIGLDGADFSEAVIDTALPHHLSTRLYENYTVWPGSQPETKQAFIDSVNTGFNFVQHVGHGYINTMSMGIEGKSFGNVDADGLTNGDETFFLYAINCTSCAIDFACIAERLILNAGGGAVAIVGSSRLDFPATSIGYQNDFFHLLFQGGENQLGKTMALSRIPFVASASADNAHRWTQMSHVYLGDPSLEFWLDVPGVLAVTHSSSFELGQATYIVDVSLDGSPLSGARVALFKDDDAYAVGYSDLAGRAELSFQADGLGEFSVGVAADGALPYLGTATVTAPASAPYVFAESRTIVDDGTGGSNGNADARIDAGETVEIRLTLKNNGSVAETAVAATLSTLDPLVTVLDPAASYGLVAAGAAVAPMDPMLVTVSRTAPDRREAKCTLTINGAVSTYQEEVILYIHAPMLEHHQQVVRDSVGNGNGDGMIGANEDFALLPRIRNFGLGTASAVEVRLRSVDPAVIITDSVSVLGDVPASTVAVNLLDGLAARFLDSNLDHELEIAVLDGYGTVFIQNVDVVAPDTVESVVSFGSGTAISLNWNPVADADLWGYRTYRSTSESGPFSRISDWTPERTSAFVDDDLPPLTRYYYRVTAVDSSGNEGALSMVASGTTSLALHEGWPVETAVLTSGGITVTDIDLNGGLEVLGAGEEIYAMSPHGGDFVDGDGDVRTLGPMTSTGSALFWNTPAVGDVDGDGDPEIAAAGWDGMLYVFDDQGIPLAGWPRDINPLLDTAPNPIGSVSMGDLDGDGDLEIICSAAKVLFAWHHDGTELVDGDNNLTTDGVLAITGSRFSYGTPSVGDVDGDGFGEVVAGMRDGKLYVFDHDGTLKPGFPLITGGEITCGPALADIDKDDRVEMIFVSNSGFLYAVRHDLTSAPGFPKAITLTEDWDPSPALGDLDGDGFLDVVVASALGEIFVYSGENGGLHPGFPVILTDDGGTGVATRSSPVIADINGDGSLDIILGDNLGRLHGLDASGSLLPGFPIQTSNRIETSAVVWDIDSDGLTEVAVQSTDQRIYLWNTPWAFDVTKAPWPMFKQNTRNSGVYGESVFAVTSVPGGHTPDALRLLENFPNPFSRATTIRYEIPEGSSSGDVRVQVFDLSGRVVRTLFAGTASSGVQDLVWDGRDEAGRPVASGIYPYRLKIGSKSYTRKLVLMR